MDLEKQITFFNNKLLNLINHQKDINKTCLYTKHPYEEKYQFLINRRETTGLKHFNNLKAFLEYLNYMDDIYKNIEVYNSGKKREKLIMFDGMIADVLSNKNFNLIITELFIRGRKLNISLVFITQVFLLYQKIHILSLRKFHTNKSFNKLHLTFHQIFTLETL